MSKRKASEVNVDYPNHQNKNKNKKMEVEFPVAQLIKRAMEQDTFPTDEFPSFKDEFQAKMSWFKEKICSFSKDRMSRSTYTKNKSSWIYIILKMLRFCEQLNEMYNTRKVISGNEYYAYQAELCQEIMKVTRTPMGLMVVEHYPRFKEVVDNKFIYFSQTTNNQAMENHPKIKELRHFAKNCQDQVFV